MWDKNWLQLVNLTRFGCVTNAYIAVVAGLIKQDARLIVKNKAHSVGIPSGSVPGQFITM